MNLSIYVPKDLQEALQDRARREGITPTRFVQQLLKDRLAEDDAQFSKDFAALAGSWEDDREADTIVADLRANRVSSDREELR